ncbi:hypothetical protein BaRGS_00014385, partial [Batillaria attramentaria]
MNNTRFSNNSALLRAQGCLLSPNPVWCRMAPYTYRFVNRDQQRRRISLALPWQLAISPLTNPSLLITREIESFVCNSAEDLKG